MLVQSGVKKQTALSPRQILFATTPQMVVGIQLRGSVGVIKAGTPVTGDLTNRQNPFTVSSAEDVVGVILHDVEITSAETPVNSECLIFGFVDAAKVESDVAALYTETVKTALNGKVFILK